MGADLASGKPIGEVVRDEVSRAERDELARALVLRGIVGTFTSEVVFRRGDPEARDDFGCPWEALSLAVRGHWLALAGTLNRVTLTPAWTGQLQLPGVE